MRLFYLREAAGLPSIAKQKVALGLEKVAEDDPVYIDINPKRKRANPGEPFPELALAIRALRPGDELGVAIPAILGGSHPMVLGVLQAIGAKQAAFYNAEKDEVTPWNPDALKVNEIASEADSFTRRASLKKARKSKADSGKPHGKPPKYKTKAAFAAARAVWDDPENTRDEAAAILGFSASHGYRVFRDPEAKPRPIFGRKLK